MGSCISKCRPKRKIKEQYNHVHDKLVISQAPTSPTRPPTSKPFSPSPSPISISSSSSSSCATSGCSLTSSLSLSSSSSCSSSVLSSKDRSFSNEFLWSCAKENPQIILLNSQNGSLERPDVPIRSLQLHAYKLSSVANPTVASVVKQSIPERPVVATPKKRPRCNSPTLSRQKSFRKDPGMPTCTYSIPSRTLGSPSPSRRFNADGNSGLLANTSKENYCKRTVSSMASAVSSGSWSMRKENHRPASPNNNFGRYHAPLRNRATYTHRIGSKIDEIAVAAALSKLDSDSIMEDVGNPLIALDCFIFL